MAAPTRPSRAPARAAELATEVRGPARGWERPDDRSEAEPGPPCCADSIRTPWCAAAASHVDGAPEWRASRQAIAVPAHHRLSRLSRTTANRPTPLVRRTG